MKFTLIASSTLALFLGTAAAIDCSAGGISCVSKCYHGGPVSCAGSTCKLNASGWYGTCVCKCRLVKREDEAEGVAKAVEWAA